MPGSDERMLFKISWLGVLLLLAFLCINLLSGPFEYGFGLARPTLAVTGILVLGSVFAFFALINAIKIPLSNRITRRRLLILILGVGLSTRLVALFTCPILEIDYYRYMWDGKVLSHGVSPYQYSPEQILNAQGDAEEGLRSLNSLAIRSESNHTILSRVHFEDYTTIYPPVSQVVFAAAMSCIPESANVQTHITWMKFVLVLFDVGTLFLILGLLQALKRHYGWLIVYAWNPLVIKEIANGGHLDSIATLFTVLSLFVFVKWFRSAGHRRGLVAASAVALGLGVGAKLFPVIIFPILFVAAIRRSKSAGFVFLLVFGCTTGVAFGPMLSSVTFAKKAQDVAASEIRSGENYEPQSKEGLSSFLSKWRMNDLVFSTLYLNLKSVERDAKRTPWVVVTSEEFRSSFCRWCNERNLGSDDPAFAATRVLTLGLFLFFYLVQLVKLLKSSEDAEEWLVEFLGRVGWIIGVFVFLQPTVNPWYLSWAIPCFCFSNNRGWLLISGVMLIYYSRFWFGTFDGLTEICGANYSGEDLYRYFVVWVTHIAVVAILWTCITLKIGKTLPLGWVKNRAS